MTEQLSVLDDPWQEVVHASLGHVFADWEQEGVRVRVQRGFFSLCAYVGVLPGHPWWRRGYDAIDLDCHGGLTYAAEGDGDTWSKGYWWLGWDYGHAGDYVTYFDGDRSKAIFARFDHSADHKWTVAEVVAEAETVAHHVAAVVP